MQPVAWRSGQVGRCPERLCDGAVRASTCCCAAILLLDLQHAHVMRQCDAFGCWRLSAHACLMGCWGLLGGPAAATTAEKCLLLAAWREQHSLLARCNLPPAAACLATCHLLLAAAAACLACGCLKHSLVSSQLSVSFHVQSVLNDDGPQGSGSACKGSLRHLAWHATATSCVHHSRLQW